MATVVETPPVETLTPVNTSDVATHQIEEVPIELQEQEPISLDLERNASDVAMSTSPHQMEEPPIDLQEVEPMSLELERNTGDVAMSTSPHHIEEPPIDLQEMEATAKPSVSAWRLPNASHKLPGYVKQKFRLKALFLLTLQFLIVFGVVLFIKMVDEASNSKLSRDINSASIATMMFLGFPAVGAMALLLAMSRKYPINFVLLVLVTLLLGVFWGVMGLASMLSVNMHYLLIGTPTLAFPAAAAFLALLSGILTSARTLVVTSLLLGWAVGSMSTVTLGIIFLDVSVDSAWIAAVGTLFLFTLLVLQAGKTLVRCNPDDFLKVVIAADSVLLIVSIPVFLLSLFWVNCGLDEEEAQDMEAEA